VSYVQRARSVLQESLSCLMWGAHAVRAVSRLADKAIGCKNQPGANPKTPETPRRLSLRHAGTDLPLPSRLPRSQAVPRRTRNRRRRGGSAPIPSPPIRRHPGFRRNAGSCPPAPQPPDEGDHAVALDRGPQEVDRAHDGDDWGHGAGLANELLRACPSPRRGTGRCRTIHPRESGTERPGDPLAILSLVRLVRVASGRLTHSPSVHRPMTSAHAVRAVLPRERPNDNPRGARVPHRPCSSRGRVVCAARAFCPAEIAVVSYVGRARRARGLPSWTTKRQPARRAGPTSTVQRSLSPLLRESLCALHSEPASPFRDAAGP
jgi:hypothetical protein